MEVAPSKWKDFLALIKIGIVNSNFITTFTGLWLAIYFTQTDGFIANLDIVLLTMIGSSLVVAGSCSLNNYIDRDIDHLMSRTKNRPTVTGRMNPKGALYLGLFLTAVGTIILAFTTITAAVIGLIGAFTYVVLYTMWSKRRNTLNTVIGSVSGAVPPLIGWAAVDPGLSLIAWILFFIMFVWQIPHFLAIAIRRCEEYRNAGIPMLPVVHGFDITRRQMLVWVACLLPLPFWLFDLGAGLIVLATLLNLGWLALSIAGFRMKDGMKWATLMFVYSLNYLTILFVSMIIVTIF
ncbi:protoheme IX farnesyltransferase [Sutcliffiella horikoshii]|uniref:Protoheme IX farnesyltransferase n=2 Tax=Sutcliffiella horikoshii TaxID=79883 RepID=A0A1Y0CT89_9BACI|nr:heme o synthase [Sutcliffiella horikoshii]ART78581.1 protoheme IX farnesyltransferase [Sutcliffiella horikoshii]TYS61736.1 protoheme IX farnesyltransferase [Sutcliffiella horikoshii]